ncbi:hypothetical protein COT99_02120 [Candidatus Falkowbacteria bacterium CG10_big_fil_rev_8_21_14_0_10_43_10]|uniref:Uncharacterized protein n=1 Tax=Candidatus Falkowbacteria bacterium CG10_big_fil_rev_8_21_14_0_10_43_10 TaxID=1974567 RepID=A0A2H0V2E4_9BACT|nr:MAG: hypothetical protein COT99_02120 [Candidatus Falkowbacteria bacterium CG10_big_fil_rev_8_21_14_0_10_43_10]
MINQEDQDIDGPDIDRSEPEVVDDTTPEPEPVDEDLDLDDLDIDGLGDEPSENESAETNLDLDDEGKSETGDELDHLDLDDEEEEEETNPTPRKHFPWWYHAIIVTACALILIGSWIFLQKRETAIPPAIQKQLDKIADNIASATEAIEAQNGRIDKVGERLLAVEDVKDRVTDLTDGQKVLSDSVADVKKRQDDFEKTLAGIRGETTAVRETTNKLSRMLVETRVLARFGADNMDTVHVGNFAIGQSVVKIGMAKKIALINEARAAGEVEVVAIWAGADADTGISSRNQELSNERSWAIGRVLKLGDSARQKASQIGIGGLKYDEVSPEDQRAGYVFIRFLKPSELMLKLAKI